MDEERYARSSSMRVFVTGGTGYIGSRLCTRLAGDGHEVRVLVRPTSRTAELEALGVTCLVGDVTDRYSMRAAMSGADWVIHAAAELDFAAGRDRIQGANVQGSENVASLAYKLGVGRVLALSSIAAFGGSPDAGSAVDESAPLYLPFPSAYSATKHAGSEAFLRWAENGLKVNLVYPGFIYGPPGRKGGLNAMLRQVIKERLPALVGGDRVGRWLHLDDLVEGLMRTVKRAGPGQHFLMTGEARSIGAVVLEAARLAGVRSPRWRLSPGAGRWLVRVMRPYYRWRGFRSPLDLEQLESLRRHWNFDDAKARSELDWSPRGLDRGLPPTVDYLCRV